MTDEERWRRWKGAVALGMVLTLVAMAVALATKSLAGVIMVLVLTSALMMFLLLTVPRGKVWLVLAGIPGPRPGARDEGHRRQPLTAG